MRQTEWAKLFPTKDSLQKVVSSFYQKLFNDTMVSFLFANTNKEKLIQTQTDFLAKAFGISQSYAGKPPASAHTHLKILPGHFDRRLKILEETLNESHLPKQAIDDWLKLENSFRNKIIT
ncbi:MAG: group 1 truncated hemoglobin [Deltaproteobacteria bacterium]|nr:group 1 truncated hemoglobin [Deltaproteobacteria bacterium]